MAMERENTLVVGDKTNDYTSACKVIQAFTILGNDAGFKLCTTFCMLHIITRNRKQNMKQWGYKNGFQGGETGASCDLCRLEKEKQQWKHMVA